MAMSKAYEDAYAIGLSRGWSHAAYVDAYLEPTLGAERDSEAVGVPSDLDASGFRTGYRDGIDRYTEGLHVDGSPMDDEG